MTLSTFSPLAAGPAVRSTHLVARVLGWGFRGPAAETGQVQRHLSPWSLVVSFAGLPVAAYAANASRLGQNWSVETFYLGIAILVSCLAWVTVSPGASRLERIEAIAALTVGLYIIRLLREPVAFVDHDEFLHWTTANHILESERLFSPNALLPISPRYPGLEIVTTALVWLTGLSVFQAAQFVLFAGRAIFMACLFFAYEGLSGSARIAACACLAYMGCSTFLVFDTQFSYESLAVVFVAACILADVRSRRAGRNRHAVFVLGPLIAALALTHHMTAYFAAAVLGGLAVLSVVKAPPRAHVVSSALVAGWALLAPLAWSHAMGDPGAGYLGPVLSNGIDEASHLLQFSAGRKLFVSTDGYVAPLWQRLVALGSVGLVCLGLAAGFFRALSLGLGRKGDGLMGLFRRPAATRAGLVLVVLLTLAYPVSMLFRLTRSGWEIGNRIGPFSFIGVAFVVAVAVVAFVRSGRGTAWRSALAVAASLVVVIGGVISAQGPRLLVPDRFKVSSDSSSVGAMAIDAATWTRQWLGERNLFSADRINRLLLSTYGRQDVASTLQDGDDTSEAVLAPRLGPNERKLLGKVGVDYLTIDMRLTTDLPGVGVYFDGGARDHDYVAPPRPEALLKFDLEPTVGKVFDDGSLFIYDLRGLDGTP